MSLPIIGLVMPIGKCVISWELNTLFPRRSPALLLFSKKHMPWFCHTERSKQTPNLRTLPASPGAGAGCHRTTVLVFPQRRGHRHLPENICPFHPGDACSFPCDGKGESIQTWSFWSTVASGWYRGRRVQPLSLGVVVNGRG